jgi:hypothetical protein
MTQINLWERVKEWIAHIAFGVFLWASGMTNAEYLDAVYEDAVREYRSELANNWQIK